MAAKVIKYITIQRVPTIATIINRAWAIPTGGLESMTDNDFLLMWQWSHVADFLRRNLIEPVGYKHSAHHHILPQITMRDNLGSIRAEFKRRGLDQRWGLDIDIPCLRGKAGEEVNATLAQGEKA